MDEATRDEGGFTLIEVMMASLVMGLVLTALAVVLTNSLVDVGYAKQREAATGVASQVVEELRATPWATLVGVANPPGAVCPPTVSQGQATIAAANPACPTVSLGGSTYQVLVYPSAGPGLTAASGGPITVTVVVSWANRFRNGRDTSVSTTTELSNCTVQACL